MWVNDPSDMGIRERVPKCFNDWRAKEAVANGTEADKEDAHVP